MIAGFELPTSGNVTLAGEDMTYISPNKRNVGMVFQSYALFPNMTVAENIGYGLKIAGKSRVNIKNRVNEMLALIHMEEFHSRYWPAFWWTTTAGSPGAGVGVPATGFTLG